MRSPPDRPVRVRTPSRKSDTISSDGRGSSRIRAGCVLAMVRPRRRCAASSGSRPDPVAVRLEQRGERAEVRRLVPVGHRRPAARHLHHPERGAQLPEVGDPAAQDLDRLDRAGPRAESDGSMASERGVRRGGVERRLDHGLDQRLLVREDPEDRALGDAGGLGDLAGGDRGAVGEDQGQRGRDDLGPALGRGAGRWLGCGWGRWSWRPTYMSERSLTHRNRPMRRESHPGGGAWTGQRIDCVLVQHQLGRGLGCAEQEALGVVAAQCRRARGTGLRSRFPRPRRRARGCGRAR